MRKKPSRPTPPGRVLYGAMIVVSRDQHGNRVWLRQDGTWTSDYAERGKWDSLPALRDSLGNQAAEHTTLRDPDYVTQ